MICGGIMPQKTTNLKVGRGENWIKELNDEILLSIYFETDRIIYSPSDLTLSMDSPFAGSVASVVSEL